jgi:YjbE family integral membrane protein
MDADTGTFLVQLLKIMWINILLSGDNAVVIALACRGLTPENRKWGIILGAGVAIVLRIIFTGVVTQLMELPYLKIIGGVLLLWIAVQLLLENADEKDIKESNNIWGAVRVIAVADLVMSLDNVVAIAAAAHGNWLLIIIGLGISIPLIVFGAQLVIMMLERWPWLVWFGAALLGWVAGELIADELTTERGLAPLFAGVPSSVMHYGIPALGAAFVVAVGYFLKSRHGEEEVAH